MDSPTPAIGSVVIGAIRRRASGVPRTLLAARATLARHWRDVGTTRACDGATFRGRHDIASDRRASPVDRDGPGDGPELDVIDRELSP
jgi:hypothetical protein